MTGRVLRGHRATALEGSLRVGPPSGGGLVDASFRHLGLSVAELSLLLAGRLDPGSLVEAGEAGCPEAFRRGVPTLWVSGHLGNWEVSAAWLASRVGPLHAVVAPLRLPGVDAVVGALRKRLGILPHPTTRAGVAAAVRALRAGGHLGILIDHRCRGRCAPVPFLGRAAPTPTAAARLAIRHAPRVFVAAAFREEDGRHRVRIARADPAPGESAAELTARWTAILDRWLRERPEQWVWVQPRWEGRRARRPAAPFAAGAAARGGR